MAVGRTTFMTACDRVSYGRRVLRWAGDVHLTTMDGSRRFSCVARWWEGDKGRALVIDWCTAMSGVRDDLSDTFDESVRVWTSVGRQSVCLVRATVFDPL